MIAERRAAIMATRSLKLRRGGDGYYRTSWVDELGARHSRSFGRRRDEAWDRFRRFCHDWARDPRLRTPGLAPPEPTVTEATDRFQAWADGHYRRPDGSPTGEAVNMEHALRPVRELFGSLRVGRFTPTALKAVRERMVADDLSLGVVNARVRRIRKAWKWFVEEELCPPEVLVGLQAVSPLAPGRCEARVTDDVTPVPDALVDAVLAVAPPTVAAMVRLQWLTGMRPGEVVIMRAVDIDTTGKVWVYRPPKHKTAHHGKARHVPLGPKAQGVLRPFLEGRGAGGRLDGYLFSPLRAIRERRGTSEDRPLPAATGRRVREHYTTQSYGRAIARLCKDHGVAHWSPQQLRHNLATRLRKEKGFEAVQLILGHSKTNVTDIYAHLAIEDAMLVAKEVG